MFNRPHTAGANKVWHPNLGALPDAASRGFTTSRWHDDGAQGFATDVFGSQDSGFSVDYYPESPEALLEKAKRASGTSDDIEKKHALAKKALEEQEAASANAHLPFVLDVYEAPAVQRAAQVTPPVIVDAALDHPASSEADGAIEVPDLQNAGAATEPQPFVGVDADVAAEAVADPLSVAAEATRLDAASPASHMPASVRGSTDDVAERDAAKLAQGVAQGHGEGLVQGIEQGLAQGHAQGLAEGLEQGLAQGLEQGLAQGLAQGLEQGLAEGREQGMKEGLALAEEQARDLQAMAEHEASATNDVMADVSAKLNDLLDNPTQFFEPLKRLALHLAEQIVKCELRTSSHAVEQLVQRCLDDLDHPAKGAVVVELNPEDKARLQAAGSTLTQGMRLDAVHDLKPSSVRVFANDMIVEDLVEHRLEALARTLLIDVDGWRKQSALVKPEVPEATEADAMADSEASMEEVSDVHP